MVKKPAEPDHTKWRYQCGVCGTSFESGADRDAHQAAHTPPILIRSPSSFTIMGIHVTHLLNSCGNYVPCDSSNLCSQIFLSGCCQFSMLRRIRCSLMNPYGPNCAPANRIMCSLCEKHFRSGGSQRRHQCLCGFTTRCMRELISHIIRRQFSEMNIHMRWNIYNLRDGNLHCVNCVCRESTCITELHNALNDQ